MKTAVILARVSTMAQDFDRQVNELKYYALNNDLNIVKIFANKISGAKSNDERCEIIELIQYVKENHVDKVLVLEISRLEALKVIELLNHEKICLCVKNYNIETLDSLGNVNPMAQFLITILLEVARMERTTIRQRMESGYVHHIQNGGVVGRKTGYRKTVSEMKEQYKEEIKLLKRNYSLRNVSKLTGTSVNTLRKLVALV